MAELGDSEFAVVLDSLQNERDRIRRDFPHIATPNIDSALEKLLDGVTPRTLGIRFELIHSSSLTDDCAV
jgi:hypothetical protein